ncbi:MAG TPA: haloacid dehalogenase type II [Pseudonocardia sp.]|nr:haloacid dehalogenase type II [Pseudonocardia sp.]
MDVRALIFDVFGTVVDWRGGVIRDGSALAAARTPGLAASSVDWPAFADAWRGRYLPSLNRVRTGELPWRNLDQLHRASLDELLAEFGADALGEADRAHLVGAWHRLDPWPDSVPGLTRLKSRYTIAPLSNGHVALLVNMAKRAGLPWDLVLSAELVHAYKPDAATYLSGPGLLGLAPGEVMMVAAHLDDLAAARSHGLRTAYVRRPLEWGPGGTAPEPRPGDELDHVVDSLTDLADRLGA